MTGNWVKPTPTSDLATAESVQGEIASVVDAGPVSAVTAWSLVHALQRYIVTYSDFRRLTSGQPDRPSRARSDDRR